MPDIDLDPRIDDYFVRLDWRDAESDLPAFSKRLVACYEAGQVILLANAPFRIDYSLLNRVNIPTRVEFKKKKDKFYRYPKLYSPKIARGFWEAFGVNLPLYLRMRQEVGRVSEQVREFVRRVFAGYEFLGTDVSWRFTQTGPEPLHIDSFGEDGDFQWVRMFINLDAAPRVWSVGQRLEDLAQGFYDSADLGSMRDAPPNRFCKALDAAALRTPERQETAPRHVVRFAQGDVWMCDSRIVSHQIVSGHRLLATHFKVNPQSMLDPEQRINARVARIHERFAPVAPVAPVGTA